MKYNYHTEDGKFDFDMYDLYKKESNKINNWYKEEHNSRCRAIDGGGLTQLQDIYDALSGGKMRDSGAVIYGHGSSYYRGTSSRIDEIVANYGSLSVGHPELIEALREGEPELVEALENNVKKMIEKVGEM